jgi:RsiW-degrading membrane proteinase PrsW (M82 family)
MFLKPFFFGIIAAGGALVLELLFSDFFPEYNFSAGIFSLSTFFLLMLMAAIEEFFKLLIIYKSLYSPKNDTPRFLFSALFLGLGFSLTEIFISNYDGISKNSGFYLGISGIIVIHTFLSGLIGWLLLKIKTINFSTMAVVLFVTTLLHFTYNIAVFLGLLQK